MATDYPKNPTGHRITPDAPCQLCGGTVGSGYDGVHAVCFFKARRGAPTPSLGDQCTCCKGSGCHPRSAVGPCNPNQDRIERWAPACRTCQGSGAVNVEDDKVARNAAREFAKNLHVYERCTEGA